MGGRVRDAGAVKETSVRYALWDVKLELFYAGLCMSFQFASKMDSRIANTHLRAHGSRRARTCSAVRKS